MEFNSKSMLNCPAPRFVCDSNVGAVKLTDYIGKWLILFSYNSNFTPVSTTEIVSFSKYNDEFCKRNCELLGISLDNVPSHIAWIKDIENSTGINVPFPLLADTDKNVSSLYSLIPKNSPCNEPSRNVYFISPEQKICCVLMYPNQTGRNVSEILRILDALQTTNSNDVETPANWMPNLSTISRNSRGYIDLMDNIRKVSRNNIDMYIPFDEKDSYLRRW